jgi:hypothetical protein
MIQILTPHVLILAVLTVVEMAVAALLLSRATRRSQRLLSFWGPLVSTNLGAGCFAGVHNLIGSFKQVGALPAGAKIPHLHQGLHASAVCVALALVALLGIVGMVAFFHATRSDLSPSPGARRFARTRTVIHALGVLLWSLVLAGWVRSYLDYRSLNWSVRPVGSADRYDEIISSFVQWMYLFEAASFLLAVAAAALLLGALWLQRTRPREET